MRVAALDLGSNSFHLLVADAHVGGPLVTIVQEKEMLRLGDVVSRHGRIPDAEADAAVATVRRFRTMAEAAGAEAVVACATSAIRDAGNGERLVERFAVEAGVVVRRIDGDEEARLVFEAVRATIPIDPGPALGLDLGGGSLEVMVGGAGGLSWCESLPLGAARLTSELVESDPPGPTELRRLRRRVRAVLASAGPHVAASRPSLLVGTGGSFNDLGRLAAYRRTGSVPASLSRLDIERDLLEALYAELVTLTIADRRRMPGLEPRRADLVPAASIVLLEAMELFGFERMTLSGWALREGMILDALRGRTGPPPGDPHALRLASVLDLCRRFGWDEVHSRHVARLALRLFDGTAGLHGLTPVDRDLLEHAALLHDVGRHVSVDAHHKHTAYLIEHGRLRGFSPQEVQALAVLGRYHRQGRPKPSFPPYATLDDGRRSDVRALVALLQLADSLDLGRAQSVADVSVEVSPGEVVLHLSGSGDADVEEWAVRRAAGLFQEVTGRQVVVAAREAAPAAAV